MDDQFIKMIRAPGAECIQELWERKPGDFIYTNFEEVVIFQRFTSQPEYNIALTQGGETRILTQEEYDRKNFTWLPTQGQLQKILNLTNRTCEIGHQSGRLWIVYGKIDTIRDPEDSFWADSMEQIWLKVLMKEKFNKIWTGERWEISEI